MQHDHLINLVWTSLFNN